jgi:hypothetical protein
MIFSPLESAEGMQGQSAAMASEGATQKEKSKRFPLLSPVILLQR